MKKHLKDYAKLLRFTKPYWLTFILASLCMAVSTIFEVAQLGLIVPVSDRILNNKEILIPGGSPDFLIPIVDKLNTIGSITLLKYIVIFLPAMFFFKGVFLYCQNYLMNLVGQGVVKEVRNQLYAKFQELSLDFYAKKRTGELMSRITNDVNFITNSLSYGLRDLIYETFKAIALATIAFSLAFRISWKLSLFAFVIFPAIMYPVSRISRRIKKFTSGSQQKMADLNSQLTETIQGAYIVKAFSRESYELARFKVINHKYYKYMLKTAKRIIVLSPLTEFIGVMGASVILWIVGQQVIQGNLSFGIFGLFLASLLSILSPIKKLSNVYAINQQALVASERIYDVLDEEPKVKEKPGARKIKELKNTVSYRNLSFKYDENAEFVLNDINLEVKKGEVIALVGHSGVGKSTMVALLPRFYDPQIGELLIDGVNIKELSLESLRSLIAIVSQEMILFNSTIRDNIAYGKLSASEDEIVQAAKKAHAFEFIKELPDGFDTVIGDRGVRLSGGQKQRLAIARAILKNAPILIFDEATSHLDSASEKLIQDAFYSLMKGKTAFIIAHRLATVQKADRIVVLEKGRIVDIGTHEKLLETDTLYKKLYDLQFNA